LIQKQKREVHEKSIVKAKNLRVSSLSTTWTQRSEENSPYSGINKVSGNILQSNGLETILQEGMEKKYFAFIRLKITEIKTRTRESKGNN